MFVAIGAPQQRTRDCYATATNLDLTLRSNGEEDVLVMDSYGQFVQAGFDAPTVAPTLTLSTNGSGLTNNKWVGYLYAYQANQAYRLVDAGVSAGGSIAPRSNPSPSGNIQVTGGIPTRHILVRVNTTTRPDITNILIYRTEYFNTQQEAIDAVNAGTAFYIGTILNDPNVAIVSFDDGVATVGGEQCDTDNYTAPIFQFCAYYDPYFWGFGNDAYIGECVVAADATFTLDADADSLFPGREGQIISFEGITTGGFDNHGNFYYKYITFNTGACYLDAAFTQPGFLDFTGDTVAQIKGQSNILYRSKAHNPFAWGETDLIGELRVPHLYAFRVGGGDGTAIAIVSNQNLLKLDTRGPSICYVLSLRLAGTQSFEASKREISRYAVSNHFSQFESIAPNGSSVLWGYDFKSGSILQCDGNGQVPISSKVFERLRSFLPFEFNHGIYDEETELVIFWMRSTTLQSLQTNDYAVLYHVPTGNWSLQKDYDVLCSAKVLDSEADKYKTIVGTSYGLIGRALDPDKANNWLPSGLSAYNKYDITGTAGDFYILTQVDGDAIFDITHPEYWIGNHVFICALDLTPLINTLTATPGMIVEVIDASTVLVDTAGLVLTGTPLFMFIGASPVELVKYTQLSSPTVQKQLTEMFLTLKNVRDLSSIEGWDFKYALELQLTNIFTSFPFTEFFHFNFNEAQAFYNKDLAEGIAFSSCIGVSLTMINANILIEMKDWSMAFQNS